MSSVQKYQFLSYEEESFQNIFLRRIVVEEGKEERELYSRFASLRSLRQ